MMPFIIKSLISFAIDKALEKKTETNEPLPKVEDATPEKL